MDKVAELVKDALSHGVTRRFGHPDSIPSEGTFYPPTLLTGVTNNLRIAREEIFGPVISILTFTDDGAVIEQANDTDYGLAGYVYSQDHARATALARALEVGIVGINDLRPLRAEVPFGGVKNSGIGREGGEDGLRDFLVAKTYSLRRITT